MAFTATATTGLTSPLKKYPGIPYSVGNLEADHGETYDPTTATFTALCTVAWADAVTFAEHMLGKSDLSVTTSTGMERMLPEPHPQNLRAYAVKMDLVKSVSYTSNDSDGWPVYDHCVYRVTYAVPLYDVLEDDEVFYEHERFCVWRKKMTAQNEKVPGLTYKFVNAAKTPLNEVGVRTGRQLELTCKWLDVPAFDYENLSTFANKINSVDINLDGTVYPQETVLFVGADEEPKVNGAQQRNRDITLSFLVLMDGRTWNKFWDKTAAGADKYVTVTDDGEVGGNKIFQSANLNNIWIFP